jgi:hypothetical protein
MKKNIAILGSALAGGAGQIIEISERAKLEYDFSIFDNDENLIGKAVFDSKVVGLTNDFFLESTFGKYDGAIIAIGGDLKQRDNLLKIAKEKRVTLVNIIDPTVVFGLSVKIGFGNVIASGVYIGNNVKIADNNYILNSVSIQHDTCIGSSNYFSTRTSIGGHSKVGDKVRFSIGEILQSHSEKVR